MNVTSIINSLDAQKVAYFGFAVFVIYCLTLFIVQRILEKIRRIESSRDDLPKSVFSESVSGKYKTLGFIFSYPKTKLVSNLDYMLIRICRFSLLLAFLSAISWLYLFSR